MKRIGPTSIVAFVTAALALGLALIASAQPGGTPSMASFPLFVISVVCGLAGFAEKSSLTRPFLILSLCINVLTGLLLWINLMRSLPM
jgi:hypothetical protein